MVNEKLPAGELVCVEESCQWDLGTRHGMHTALHQMYRQHTFRIQHEHWEQQQESLLSGKIKLSLLLLFPESISEQCD